LATVGLSVSDNNTDYIFYFIILDRYEELLYVIRCAAFLNNIHIRTTYNTDYIFCIPKGDYLFIYVSLFGQSLQDSGSWRRWNLVIPSGITFF
jgi:hypothetical protein